MADLIPEDIQLEMAACRNRFKYFIQKTFTVVSPGVSFSNNWHIDLMAEYLEACYRRQIKRLVINVPPRSLKSVSVSIALPAWWLGLDPTAKFMCASYSEKLAFDLSMDTRRMMTDPWYRLCFPNTVIADDQNEKSKFSTKQQGYRIATSVGGRATGFGANCFPAGTRVSAPQMNVCIEDIKVGDYVMAYDGIIRPRRVIAVKRQLIPSVLCHVITLGGKKLECTPEHRIYLQSLSAYVEASTLRHGDVVFCRDGTGDMVENVWSSNKGGWIDVYDIQVESAQNFFANDILVHNCLIVDDCHTPEEAMSDTIREGHLRWFDNTWSSRLNDKNNDVMIVVGQRLHQRDLPGHLLAQGGWDSLILPAIFESRKTYSFGSVTKTVVPGDLLHPARFSKKFLDAEKKKSSFGFAGQYMQNPVPEGGGIIKYDWFELWPAKQKLPRFVYVIQVWDTAFTEKTAGDPSACCTFGVFFPEEEVRDSVRQMGGGFAVMLIDCFQEHMGFPALRAKMIEMRGYRYGEQEKAVDLILVEAKASGQSIVQEFENANLPIKKFNPGRLDKTSRLHAVSHFIENGLVYIPESTRTPGEFRDWASDFVDQICSFPAAPHDEYVDCISSALITLSNMTFLRLQDVADDVDEPDGSDPYAYAGRPNPYGS